MNISWFSAAGLEKLRQDHKLRYGLAQLFAYDVKRALKSVKVELDEQTENEFLSKLLGSAYKIFLLGYNADKAVS
ncbi:hypothetical protein [Zhaonella formicivorans]|jgi:hypothetical protein|uniref:hypothetical protein n=1 Tax=Zhaonella formicivorans TaxID=2528593 RepID=UPI0010D2C573|nr:hypothetical protein [Zhaonella formicivorans]